MELNKKQLVEIITAIVDKTLKNSAIIPAGIINSGSAPAADTNKKDSEKNAVSGGSLKLLNKKLIVEEDIRCAVKKNILTVEVNKSAKITPLAADMILHKKIKLIKH